MRNSEPSVDVIRASNGPGITVAPSKLNIIAKSALFGVMLILEFALKTPRLAPETGAINVYLAPPIISPELDKYRGVSALKPWSDGIAAQAPKDIKAIKLASNRPRP